MRPSFTATEKHRELLREIEMRKWLYSSRVLTGSMSRHQAEQQIAIMQAIADDYAKAAEQERLP